MCVCGREIILCWNQLKKKTLCTSVHSLAWVLRHSIVFFCSVTVCSAQTCRWVDSLARRFFFGAKNIHYYCLFRHTQRFSLKRSDGAVLFANWRLPTPSTNTPRFLPYVGISRVYVRIYRTAFLLWLLSSWRSSHSSVSTYKT